MKTPSVRPHLHLNSAFTAVVRARQSQTISSLSYHTAEQIVALAPAIPLEVCYLAKEGGRENSLMNSAQ